MEGDIDELIKAKEAAEKERDIAYSMLAEANNIIRAMRQSKAILSVSAEALNSDDRCVLATWSGCDIPLAGDVHFRMSEKRAHKLVQLLEMLGK